MLEIIRDDKEIFEVSNGTIGFKFFKLGKNNFHLYLLVLITLKLF